MPGPQNSITSAITSDTESRVILDAGVLYRNWGMPGQEIVGATREGATFEVTRDLREIPVDGAPGAIQELTRVVRTSVMLECVLVEISGQTFLDALRGTATTQGSRTWRSAGDLTEPDDFWVNVALVAAQLDDGSERSIVIKNALNAAGGWTIKTRDKGEWGMELTVKGHFRAADLTTIPFQEGVQAGLLRDWYPNTGSGQALDERIYEQDGVLGSTSGSDTNDPTWGSSPPTLTFGSDDYVTEDSTPWATA